MPFLFMNFQFSNFFISISFSLLFFIKIFFVIPQMARRLKDKNAPKRPLTGFLLYGNDLRKNNADIKALPVTQQATEIAKYWKDLPESEKKVYNQQSEVLKEAYKKELAAYEQSEDYKNFKQAQAEFKETSNTKTKKRQGNTKMSGYRLFVKENKDTVNEGLDESEVGKRHIAKCGMKWKMLSEAEQKIYNDRAAAMAPEKSNVNNENSVEAEE